MRLKLKKKMIFLGNSFFGNPYIQGGITVGEIIVIILVSLILRIVILAIKRYVNNIDQTRYVYDTIYSTFHHRKVFNAV